jgi:AhpD family alkylhydroperoxidase
MKHPGALLPEAMPAIMQILGSIYKSGISPSVLGLTHLRASQINGCSFCVDYGVKEAKKQGETDERLGTVAAWREAPYFSEAERAALALAEAATRLSDRSDQVPDDVWNEAAKHFEEKELAALVLNIAITNFFNRINVTLKTPAGTAIPSAQQSEGREAVGARQ